MYHKNIILIILWGASCMTSMSVQAWSFFATPSHQSANASEQKHNLLAYAGWGFGALCLATSLYWWKQVRDGKAANAQLKDKFAKVALACRGLRGWPANSCADRVQWKSESEADGRAYRKLQVEAFYYQHELTHLGDKCVRLEKKCRGWDRHYQQIKKENNRLREENVKMAEILVRRHSIVNRIISTHKEKLKLAAGTSQPGHSLSKSVRFLL